MSYRERASRSPGRVLGILLGLLAALHQLLLSSQLLNDHFMNVTWGREILAGRLPVRDFFEAGEPLSELLSAGAEALVGYRLLSEGLLVAAAIGVSTWVVFWVTGKLTNAITPAAIAASLVIIAGTRSYSYPKVLLYAVAAAFIWRYIQRPSTVRLVVLACWTAIGFLFRHDHGLYLACGTALTICIAHGLTRQTVARVLQAGGLALLVAAPYLLWVQAYRGIPQYVADGAAVIRSEFSDNPFDLPRWPLRRVSDFVRIEPQAAYAPMIKVRWADGTTLEQRAEAIRQFHLRDVDATESHIVIGRLLDPSRPNIRALLNDPSVVDTAGIDRGTSSVPRTSWGLLDRLRFRSALARMRPFPVFDDLEEAGRVAAWLFILLPLTALVASWPGAAPQTADLTSRHTIAAIAGLLLVAIPGLQREPLRVYTGDLVALPAILAGYLAWWFWYAARTRKALGRLTLRITTIGLTALLIFSVGSVGMFGRRVSPWIGEGESLAKARETWSEAWERLTTSPPVAFWDGKPAATTVELARYVHACTVPGTPLLVVSFAPELQYYADRPLASRHLLLGSGRWTSVADQEASLEKLRHEPPPVVIAEDPFYSETFTLLYPLIADYLRQHYEGHDAIGDHNSRNYVILTRIGLAPVSREREHGWPCFTTGRPGHAR